MNQGLLLFFRFSVTVFLVILLFPGIALLAPMQVQAAGELPSGTENQTLRYDGLNWVANSLLSNSGSFVGVGTGGPTKLLHVKGGIALFERGVDSAGFIVQRTPTNRWVLGVNESPTLGNGFVLSTIPTGNTSIPRLLVTQDGRVGIGTLSPGSKLQVRSDSEEAVSGWSNTGRGITGQSGSNIGVWGISTNETAVQGNSTNSYGVIGDSTNSIGVSGSTDSSIWYGVAGNNHSNNNLGHLAGGNYGAYGYHGSSHNTGYLGSADYGVYGRYSGSGPFGYIGGESNGVYGYSGSGNGVYGWSPGGNGIYGRSDNSSSYAGYFQGNLEVTKKLGILESGASPSKSTFLQGGDQTTDITYTLPTADGSSGQVLSTNGSGALSWTTASGGSLPSGTVNQTLRHNGTAWVASSTLSNTGSFVGVGLDNPTNILHVTGTGPGTMPLFERGTDSAGLMIRRDDNNRFVIGVNQSPSLGSFAISSLPVGKPETAVLKSDVSGNITIPGNLSVGGTLTTAAGRLDVRTAAGNAVYGETSDNTSYGVMGKHTNTWSGPGVYGEAVGNGDLAPGVMGKNITSNNWGLIGGINYGALGINSNGNNGILGGPSVGAYGRCGTSGPWGYFGSGTYGLYGAQENGTYAGYFQGNVHVQGTFTSSDKQFKIDHPQDPENKYLSHSVIESPDMMNVYNGNIMLDGNGEAVVQLPSYFESLNRDFRYQLTAIGTPGPNLYIAEEITGNSFRIAGGKVGMKVSWMVTGIRNDAYANAHPIAVEQEKPASEKGLYLNPGEWGQPAEKGIANLNKPQH